MSVKQPMTEKRITEAAKLWSDGLSTMQISTRLGIPKGTICSLAIRHRDLFPVRMVMNRMLPKEPKNAHTKPGANPPSSATYIAGKWVEHVKRTTRSGAVVTMPRVSFIDGVREGAD